MGSAPIVQLERERERKIIIDTFKMAAYHAKTQLANLVGPMLPDHEQGRFLLP